MDMAQLQRLDEWVCARFGERVSTRQMAEEADASELPQEAKRVVFDLPEGEWLRDEVLAKLHEIATERYGAGYGTTMAAKEGGSGVFGE